MKRFDGEFPNEYFDVFLKYCDISADYFHEIIDGWRSPHLWKKVDGKWHLKHPIWK